MGERLLPQDIASEEALLGAILIDPEALEVAIDLLQPSYFYRIAHQEIYSAILRVHARNEAADFVTVGEEIERSGKDEVTGGAHHLLDLINRVPTSGNAQHYARIIERKWRHRELANAAGYIAAAAYEEDEDAFAEAESLIYKISQGEATSKPVSYHTDALNRYMLALNELHEQNSNGAITGVPTGFPQLTTKLGGFRASKLYILAARPGDGKTSLALCFADEAVRKSCNVLFFSLEMEEDELMQRWMAMEAHVDSMKLRDGRLSSIPDYEGKTEWDRVMEAFDSLQSLPGKLLIDDNSDTTISQMRSKARRLHREIGLDMIIVDYLQIAQVEKSDGKKYTERRLEVEEISRSLKRLARELKIPVLSLAQINRNVESRENHVPRLSDLREAGGIEQDCDVAMFLHKDPNIPKDQTTFPVNLLIEKNRHGEKGLVPLIFKGSETRFRSADNQHNNE